MKKLLILTAVAVLAASSIGCCGRRARNAWYRGAICTPPVVSSVGNCYEPATCCDSGYASGGYAPSGEDAGSYIDGYFSGGAAGCSSCDSGGSVTTIPVDPAPGGGYAAPDRTSRPVPEPNDT